MKMLEEVKGLKKEFVFEGYSRIIENFKDYEKITKVKMVEEIYKLYQDFNNIIDICTTKELNYLKMYFDNDEKIKFGNYYWEENNLSNKFILSYVVGEQYEVPEEIYDVVFESVQNVDWDLVKKKGEINEVLVSYCKVQGSCLIYDLIEFGCDTLKMKEKDIVEHINKDKVFNYYVFNIDKCIEGLDQYSSRFVFHDYIYILDELEGRKELFSQKISNKIGQDDLKSLFYNDFNLNNIKIKKLNSAIINFGCYIRPIIQIINEYSLLNIDRTGLKKQIQLSPFFRGQDLTSFFELLDEAMDEMYSAALNGLSPNEYKKIPTKIIHRDLENVKNYVKQQNACLSQKDAKLFYKLYFGVLDFTNQLYKIKSNYKLYKKTGINPEEIIEIIDVFWELKDEIILKFCASNPYNFNKEEIKIVQGFRKGIIGNFVIMEYHKEYTAIMNGEKTFMIKGITSPIDQIIPHNELPYIVKTVVLPFKDKLIYDGVFMSFSISLGNEFVRLAKRDYEKQIKYYYL